MGQLAKALKAAIFSVLAGPNTTGKTRSGSIAKLEKRCGTRRLAMINHSYDELTDRILGRIHEEVLKTQYTTGETNVTIFLRIPLFLRIQASLDYLVSYVHPDIRSTKLFGCSVERYEDQGLAFYVTTAKKITY